MNNIFYTYNSNSLMNKFKSIKSDSANFDLNEINKLVNGYYVPSSSEFNKHMTLTKFVRAIINVNFGKIQTTDLRPILLLGLSEIKPIHLTLSEGRLVGYLNEANFNLSENKKQHHYEITMSIINGNIGFSNRDEYVLSGKRELVKKLITSNQS